MASSYFFRDPKYEGPSIVQTYLKKEKSANSVSRMFSDLNTRFFTLNLQNFLFFYTPKEHYQAKDIRYIDLTTLNYVVDGQQKNNSSGKAVEWSFKIILYFKDKYMNLYCQNQQMKQMWYHSFRAIVNTQTNKSLVFDFSDKDTIDTTQSEKVEQKNQQSLEQNTAPNNNQEDNIKLQSDSLQQKGFKVEKPTENEIISAYEKEFKGKQLENQLIDDIDNDDDNSEDDGEIEFINQNKNVIKAQYQQINSKPSTKEVKQQIVEEKFKEKEIPFQEQKEQKGKFELKEQDARKEISEYKNDKQEKQMTSLANMVEVDLDKLDIHEGETIQNSKNNAIRKNKKPSNQVEKNAQTQVVKKKHEILIFQNLEDNKEGEEDQLDSPFRRKEGKPTDLLEDADKELLSEILRNNSILLKEEIIKNGLNINQKGIHFNEKVNQNVSKTANEDKKQFHSPKQKQNEGYDAWDEENDFENSEKKTGKLLNKLEKEVVSKKQQEVSNNNQVSKKEDTKVNQYDDWDEDM